MKKHQIQFGIKKIFGNKIYLFIYYRFTLIEAFISAQTPASLNAVLKYLNNSMNAKNKGELIELFIMSSAFAPRPSDLLLEVLLVMK